MKQTILIVDDNLTNLELLVRLLADQGYRVLVAEDGLSAIEQVPISKPDLILLDVSMPEINGFETCRRLKSIPEVREIPVIFLTARSQIEEKLEGFACGGVDYILKPIQKEEVLARVNTHLTLRQQQVQLERLLAERHRLTQLAAHDLRNLLTVIGGYLQIGLDSKDSTGKQQALRRIEDAYQRIDTLLDEFLCLNESPEESSGAQETFDLRMVITRVVEHAGVAARAKGLSLTAQLPASSCMVGGSAGNCHQIILNFVTNAIKFSRPGTAVRVSLQPREQSWCCAVQDQGPGVPPNERERLFQPFSKISNRPTGGEISTGLGLSIGRQLAEQQGGRVGASFPEEGGSRFWISLPMLHRVAAPASELECEAQSLAR